MGDGSSLTAKEVPRQRTQLYPCHQSPRTVQPPDDRNSRARGETGRRPSVGYAGYNFYEQVIRVLGRQTRAGRCTAQSLVYAVVGYFFIQAAIAFSSR
jgi:hypothetical protein